VKEEVLTQYSTLSDKVLGGDRDEGTKGIRKGKKGGSKG
jgi:hypothetical protein